MTIGKLTRGLLAVAWVAAPLAAQSSQGSTAREAASRFELAGARNAPGIAGFLRVPPRGPFDGWARWGIDLPPEARRGDGKKGRPFPLPDGEPEREPRPVDRVPPSPDLVEALIVVPEPVTMVLLATGLLLLGTMTMARRFRGGQLRRQPAARSE